MNQSAELVLVVSDMNVPFKTSDIPEQFKSLLIPNKIQHVLSLGNMGSKESYDWLKTETGKKISKETLGFYPYDN